MIQWLEPRDRLDSDQTTATPCSKCSTLEVVKFVILQDFSISLYGQLKLHIPDNLGEWMNGEVYCLMRSVPLWSKF